MRVVYLNTKADPKKKEKRVSPQRKRALRWMAKQYQRLYDRAVSECMDDIKEIQKYIPGWMPEKDF